MTTSEDALKLNNLYKSRIKPGGLEATGWLVRKARMDSDKKILEIASNNGSTMINLHKKYNCTITGVDFDEKVVNKANQAIKDHNLSKYLNVCCEDLLDLPFEKESFDIILCEEMFSLVPNETKKEIAQYLYTFLKSGGYLLFQDILFIEKSKEAVDTINESMKADISPINEDEWKSMLLECGYKKVDTMIGDISVIESAGLIRDERKPKIINIFKNIFKKDNIENLLISKEAFSKYKDIVKYIAISAKK